MSGKGARASARIIFLSASLPSPFGEKLASQIHKTLSRFHLVLQLSGRERVGEPGGPTSLHRRIQSPDIPLDAEVHEGDLMRRAHLQGSLARGGCIDIPNAELA